MTPNTFDYNAQRTAIQNQIDQLRQGAAVVPSVFQIRKVSGIDKAKEMQAALPPGSSEIVLDSEEDKFYVLVKDANGVSPELMMIGTYTLEQEEKPVYVTKTDFDEFATKIIGLLSKEEKE